MKKLDIKSILIGFLIGTISFGAVSATNVIIDSAQYNNTKILFNGEELQLSQPMITVKNKGSNNGSNYMPVRAVLEAMNYEVDWNGKENAILINNIDENIIEESKDSNNNITIDFTMEEFIDLFIIHRQTIDNKCVVLLQYDKPNEKIDIQKFNLFFKENEINIYKAISNDVDVNIFEFRVGFNNDIESIYERVIFQKDTEVISRIVDSITKWNYNEDLYK